MKNLLDSIRTMYAVQSEATMMQDDGKVVHNCAKHVEHAEWGQGNCISEEHAAPDADGNIAWYDIMFEHGLERQVPTSSLKIVQAESHMHAVKKAKKVAEAAPNAPTSIDPKQDVKKQAMNAALDAANKQGTTGEIDKIVHQGVTKEDFDAEISALNLTEAEISDIEEAYMGMKKLTGQLKAKGATNAPGLAAYIGRKKYGKEKFQAAAAAGRKLKEEDDKEEKLEDDDVKAAGHKKSKEKFETMSKMPERMKEDIDQIDELSKKTLGSYVKKAKEHAVGLGVGLGVAAMKRVDRSDVADKLKQRTKNIDKAVDRITNEEVDLPEEVDETIITAVKEYDVVVEKDYKAYFNAKMKAKGKSIGTMSDDEKKKFFNDVDAGFKAKNEDVFLEAYMASDLIAVKDAHKKAGNKISNEITGSKNGEAHHSFVVTTPAGKRTRHIYHGKTKKVETMSAAPRSKEAKETDVDDEDK